MVDFRTRLDMGHNDLELIMIPLKVIERADGGCSLTIERKRAILKA
jgi:hypothetical protein